MAKLSKKKRAGLSSGAFALPGRRFPVNDRAHAKAAILDSGSLPPDEHARVVSRAKKVLARSDKKKGAFG